MCGIVGFITTETGKGANTRLRYMRQALIADTMRGDDSTGAFFVPHDIPEGSTAGWAKGTAAGYDFVNYNKEYDEYIGNGSENFAVFGHNRAATIGGVNVDTAHPFQEGAVTLVHNGTLRSTYSLPKSQYQHGFYNDSHCLTGNLSESSIKELSPNINGAFALAWHDARDGSINLVRNNERPLHLATVKGQDTIFIASEAMMLQWILSRLNLEIKHLAYPKPYQHMRWEHGNITPEIFDLPKYEAPTYGNAYNTRGGGYGNQGTHGGWSNYYDDDDDDYVYSDGIYRPKAQPRQQPPMLPAPGTLVKESEDSRIAIGGRKQPVPIRAQELLLEFDMLVEDREIFEPIYESQPGWSKKTKMVIGTLLETGMSAIVYNVPITFTEGPAINREWVVQPITIKMNDPNEPVVICKLKHTDATSGSGRAMLSACRTSDNGSQPASIVEEDDIPFDAPTNVEIGNGNGGYMELNEYLRRTGGGCISCSGNIYVGDADNVVWVNDGVDPMCPVCVEETMDMEDQTNAN